MNFAQQDFDYYERTIKIMYQKYYQKRIGLIAVAMVIIGIYTGLIQENYLLNGCLLLILAAILIYLISAMQKFPEIYRQLLVENQPVKVRHVQEDEYSYNFTESGELVRINKNGVRNLPANDKQYTMMVGFAKEFFSREPLKIIYYDVLELTYTEKFRLKRNGYSGVPRFLRRFTLSNLKASAGNAVSFLLGNIFVWYLVYRLLRYLITMLGMMM